MINHKKFNNNILKIIFEIKKNKIVILTTLKNLQTFNSGLKL